MAVNWNNLPEECKGDFSCLVWPGKTFRVNERSSYGNQVVITIEVDGRTLDFCRCSEGELSSNVIKSPSKLQGKTTMKTTKLTTCETRAKAYAESIRNNGGGPIVIEWRKSKMWGNNPVIENYAGEKCCNVSGCGYCKESTALADVLQFFGDTAEQRSAIARTGGAGVSSVAAALASIGWKLERLTGTKSADVYRIERE